MRTSGTSNRQAHCEGSRQRDENPDRADHRDRGDDMRSCPCSQRVPCTRLRVSALPALGERDGDLNEERRQQHPTKQAPVARALADR